MLKKKKKQLGEAINVLIRDLQGEKKILTRQRGKRGERAEVPQSGDELQRDLKWV